MSRAICVVGMHRSGTSVITRVIQLLGAYLGEEADLMVPRSDNPQGYWERQDIYFLHERILEALDRTWDTSFPLPEAWYRLKKIAPLRQELIELINTYFIEHQLWAWKDPRSSLLLPLWKDVLDELGIELICLLIARNPLDVARSLEKREGFSQEESFGLWFNHNLFMLQNTKGLPRALIYYDDFLRDWESALRRCMKEFSISWPQESTSLRKSIREAIRPDLCHSSSKLDDLKRVGCPAPVIELARIFKEIAESGTFESLDERRFNRLLKHHLSFSSLYCRDVTRRKETIEDLERIVAERDEHIAGLREHTANLEGIVSERDEHIAGLREHTTDLERIVSERDEHIAGLGEHTANLERIVSERDQHIAGLREHAANLEAIVTDLRRFEARVKRTPIYKVYRLLRLHRLLNRSAGT